MCSKPQPSSKQGFNTLFFPMNCCYHIFKCFRTRRNANWFILTKSWSTLKQS